MCFRQTKKMFLGGECVFVKRTDVLGWMMNVGGWGGVMTFVVDCQQRSSSWMMNVFLSNEDRLWNYLYAFQFRFNTNGCLWKKVGELAKARS